MQKITNSITITSHGSPVVSCRMSRKNFPDFLSYAGSAAASPTDRLHTYAARCYCQGTGDPGSIASLPVLLALLLATTPITRVGPLCPYGYYRSSDYCVPLRSAQTESITRTGTLCPYGWVRSAGYCTRLD